MHNKFRRLPAEQVGHRKRMLKRHSSGWSDDAAPIAARQVVVTGNGFTTTLTGPLTITKNIPPATPTTTPLTDPLSSPPSPPVPPTTPSPAAPEPPIVSQQSISFVPVSSPPVSVAPSLSAPPAPVASAINPESSSPAGTKSTYNANGSNGSGSLGAASTGSHPLVSTGAIVGITLGCVVLVVGALVFFVRQRAVRQRKLRRGTAAWAQGAAGFAQPPPQPVGGAFPATPGMAERTGAPSPGVSFARAQAAALAARDGAGAPAMPAAVPSSYNNPVSAPGAGGAVAAVLYEYIPSLPDELAIVTGEVVRIQSEFDDGWALCVNARGEQGMVPLECLDRTAGPGGAGTQLQTPFRDSRRSSSLVARRI